VVELGFNQAVEGRVEQQLGMRATAALVAYASLLELSTAEVETLVEHELDQNPALEREEPEYCANCRGVILASGCTGCRSDRGSPVRSARPQVQADAVEAADDPVADWQRRLFSARARRSAGVPGG
jgi:DNA-directed RNA polymerase specialized sigma54-like protein